MYSTSMYLFTYGSTRAEDSPEIYMCAYAMPIVRGKSFKGNYNCIPRIKGPGKHVFRAPGSKVPRSLLIILTYTPWGEQRSLSCVLYCTVLYFHQHDFAIRSQDFPSALVFRARTLVCVVMYTLHHRLDSFPFQLCHNYLDTLTRQIAPRKERLLSHIIMIFVQGSKILTRGGAPRIDYRARSCWGGGAGVLQGFSPADDPLGLRAINKKISA